MATTHPRNPKLFSKHPVDPHTERRTSSKNEVRSDPEVKPEGAPKSGDAEIDPKAPVSTNLKARSIRSGVTMLPPAVVWKRRGKKRSSHYKDIQTGLFIEPVEISERSRATPDYEVDTLIAARIAGKSDEEIRALVRELRAARKEAL